MIEYSEFAEACLQNSPCGTLVLDDAGRIHWMNRALEEMLEISAERMQGKTTDNLPSATHQELFDGEGLLHLQGAGTAQERWLQCTVAKQGKLTCKFYLDVTESVQLRSVTDDLQQQVEELTITDELTGLANQRALNRALSTQVTRSRRYNNPLSLAVVELADDANPEPTFDDDIILGTSRYLRDRLRWVDLIARWDHNHFVVVLPETNAEDARSLVSGISEGFEQAPISAESKQGQLRLRFGLAQWQKGNDSRLLMERAAEDLNAGAKLELSATTP